MRTRYEMQTENLYCFFVWYVITCYPTTYRASRNRFSVIIFHDYLYYCGIFLARFLITVVLNIISSLHMVFSLCARVGWCDVWTEFTNSIKVDVDVNEMPLLRWAIHHIRLQWKTFYPLISEFTLQLDCVEVDLLAEILVQLTVVWLIIFIW